MFHQNYQSDVIMSLKCPEYQLKLSSPAKCAQDTEKGQELQWTAKNTGVAF